MDQQALLSNVRVLDLTRVVAGPYATTMLADMGADVVKVEEPLHGDELRWIRYKGREAKHEDYFNASNRSKRSITLNLKVPEERAIAHDLARKADALVENFAPGVAERLGMGWRELHELNPKLVYCSISGFGQTGPYRARIALDPVIQALTGVMSVNGYEGEEPLQIGAPIADVVAGMFGAYTVVCALSDATRTGKGRYIDISMQDAMLAVLGPRVGEPLQAGYNPTRYGNANGMRVPANTYRTADGKYVATLVQNDNHWERFCRALDKPHWYASEKYRTMADRAIHRDELDRMVAEEFGRRTAAEWGPRLDENRIPFGVVNTYLEAVEDPQIKHRGLIKEVSHPVSGKIRMVGAPWKVSDTDERITPPPLLGQHTAEVLTDWLSWPRERAEKVQEAHKRLRAQSQ